MKHTTSLETTIKAISIIIITLLIKGMEANAVTKWQYVKAQEFVFVYNNDRKCEITVIDKDPVISYSLQK